MDQLKKLILMPSRGPAVQLWETEHIKITMKNIKANFKIK